MEISESNILSSEIATDLIEKNTFIRRKDIIQKIENGTKRIIDIIGGITGMILLVPMICGIYIARKINKEKGSMFFVQERIGKDGKKFKLYKFRSMVIGADRALEEYLEKNPEAKEEYKKYKKLKNDPRITKTGEFLRKTSIDEFPQFINILKGEMSLVGPRPYLPREKEDMGESYNTIVKCKPGLTGLWQISGRSDTSFEERLELDIEYYKKRTLKEDLLILKQTIVNVIRRKGAI